MARRLELGCLQVPRCPSTPPHDPGPVPSGRPGARALRYTDGRPLGAGNCAISMGNAQKGAWLLVMPLPYPRQILPSMCVQWPSQARDACAKKLPKKRSRGAIFCHPRAAFMAFSSTVWVHNYWYKCLAVAPRGICSHIPSSLWPSNLDYGSANFQVLR